MDCVSDILYHDKVQRLTKYEQHCHTSRLQHCINVSYYSFLVCRKFGWDYRSAARGALLHDLFYYDWRTTKLQGTNHAIWHPRVALDNAKKVCHLNAIEQDCIRRHMWPMSLIPPKFKESYVVNVADKMCASVEATGNFYKFRFAPKVYRTKISLAGVFGFRN